MVDVPGDITSTAVLDTQDAILGTFSGQLEVAGDHDFIKVVLDSSFTYDFYLSFLNTGSLTLGDAIIVLRDAAGVAVPLGTDDNAGVGDNAHLFITPPTSGTFFLDLGEVGDNNTGDYSLVSTANFGAVNINRTDGDDVYTTIVANERTVGGKGDDILTLAADGLDALGEQGDDILTGNDLGNLMFGGLGNDLLSAAGGSDQLFGESGDDQLIGGGALDVLRGGAGNDTLNGSTGNDLLIGGEGNDIFVIIAAEGLGDTFIDSAGIDSLQVLGVSPATLAGFNAGAVSIEKWVGNNKGVIGTSAANILDFSDLTSRSGWTTVDGRGGNDTITGLKFADKLLGNTGNDVLSAGLGNDILTGGLGRDTQTGGGNRDFFDFNSLAESRKGATRDIIKDLSRAADDRIDLRTIDADTDGTAGNQAFKFIGTAAFHGIDGELRCKNGIVQGDVNGDKVADFEIKVNLASLVAGDFFL